MVPSSPRTRGCSAPRTGHSRQRWVVPAHAGVFLATGSAPPPRYSRPRARGGVPLAARSWLPPSWSSPRTRGCSSSGVNSRRSWRVVPAHAGVFRRRSPAPCRSTCRPRARGGVPYGLGDTRLDAQSSPRTRGCSEIDPDEDVCAEVVPAHAGVFRMSGCGPAAPARRPRARGGVPKQGVTDNDTIGSSPRTRGCSSVCRAACCACSVVPAHAGVFLSPTPRSARCWGRPRARGGVPKTRAAGVRIAESSPRTRGCSTMSARLRFVPVVVPAHAGVFPCSGT